MTGCNVEKYENWAEEVHVGLRQFLQGDVIDGLPMFLWADSIHPIAQYGADTDPEGRVIEIPRRSHYGILLTQTCDIVQSAGKAKSSSVQLAPVLNAYDLDGDGSRSNALRDDEIRAIKLGKNAHRFWLPNLGNPETDCWYVDLLFEVAVDKSWLSRCSPRRVFNTHEERQKFINNVAWIKGRPSIDGNFITKILSGIQESVRKIRKENREFFDRMSNQIVEFTFWPDDPMAVSKFALSALHVNSIDEDVRKWWVDQLANAEISAKSNGIDCLRSCLESSESLSTEDYRHSISLHLPDGVPQRVIWRTFGA